MTRHLAAFLAGAIATLAVLVYAALRGHDDRPYLDAVWGDC